LLLWAFVAAVVVPVVAYKAGRVAAEVGRQPWVIQGLLRTSESYTAITYRVSRKPARAGEYVAGHWAGRASAVQLVVVTFQRRHGGNPVSIAVFQ
jgi:hypothetical protein